MIAEGAEFSDGTAAMRWRTLTKSTGFYNSMSDLVTIHGHQGQTRVVWVDEAPVDWTEAVLHKT